MAIITSAVTIAITFDIQQLKIGKTNEFKHTNKTFVLSFNSIFYSIFINKAT